MTNKSRLFAAVAGAMSLGATAWAAEPAQMDAKIQQLEAKVASLEAKQAQNSKDLAATVDAVLRDAEKRSQLLANGGEMGAGYDGGFYIRAGENWVLRPSVLFQFWNNTTYRQDVVKSSGGTDDQLSNGFEVHRLELAFEGTAFMKELTYEFRWMTGPDSGDLSLLDAYVRYMFADDWGVRMGQYKDLVSHESLIGDQYLLAAERTLLNQILGGGYVGRTQGASLVYGGYNKTNPVNAEVAFTDGIGQANTDFTKKQGPSVPAIVDGQPVRHEFDFGVTGRVEYKVLGDWRDYRDLTAKGDKEDLLVLGAGGDWSQSSAGNSLVGALDAQYETASGLMLYGAGLIRHLNSDISSIGQNTTDWGLQGEVAYMLNPSWEVFSVVDWTKYGEAVSSGANETQFWEVSVGVNYYMGNNGSAGHRAKFTIDGTWFPNGVPTTIDFQQIGAQDQNDGANEFMLRAQFQLLI
ncbi:MAG: porin [Planctomycetota bacterium]|nr:porin [Planctomycetota bacterium]